MPLRLSTSLHPSRISNQDMGEPGFRVGVVEAACCDQGVGTGPDADSILGSGEQGVAHGELDGSVGVFNRDWSAGRGGPTL